MNTPLLVAVDVGSQFHQVAVGDSSGCVLDEFRIDHDPASFAAFFERVERHRCVPDQRIRVAMEGYNGWARPLDSQTLERGWDLYNVNNLKLARYKEIFPAPAGTDAIDTRRMLELFTLDGHRAWPAMRCSGWSGSRSPIAGSSISRAVAASWFGRGRAG